MAITDPTDLAVAHWYDGPSASASPTWTDLGSGGDDMTGSGNMGFGTSINGLQTIDPNGAREVVFGASIAQPNDIFIVGITNSFSFLGTDQIIQPASSGSGHTLGWTASAGGSGHQGRLYADCGSAVDAPDDRRVIEEVVYVFHLRANGADSEVRINGAYYWSGDFGSDAMDGLQIAGNFDYGEIVVAGRLLTDIEVGQMLEYFNARWGKPDWAPNRYNVAIVASSDTPADTTPAARLRFVVEQRGHSVTYVASADVATTDLTLYAATLYGGDYADAAVNGPVIKALLDAGQPQWISLYESGMSGAVTNGVASQCFLVDEVNTISGGGTTASVVSHSITDFLGTPPQTITGRAPVAAVCHVAPADDAIGTLIRDNGSATIEWCYAIEVSTTDLNSGTTGARVVISGDGMAASQYYFSDTRGEQVQQNEVDWILDNLPPTVINTVTSGLRLISPRFGEIIDPLYDDVTFRWQARAGRTATLQITTDISASPPTWVTAASGLSVTSHAVDMSDPVTWPEGIWYGWRIVWDDGVIWTHPGFKLLSVTSDPDFEHYYQAFETNPAGTTVHSFAWTQARAWWGGTGGYFGLAAKVLEGSEAASMATPAGVPSGFQSYEISAYMRVGALTSPYFGQSTKYWAAEGQQGGLGLYATGTDIGVHISGHATNIFPLPPCPGEGRDSIHFGVSVRDGSGNVTNSGPTAAVATFHAFPSPCWLDDGLVPLRLVVERRTATTAFVYAGIAGYGGTSYALYAETVPFDFATAGDQLGWVLGKIAGNEDAGGFRDMYSLSVSAFNAAGGSPLPPSVEPEPSRPCVVQFDLYAPDRTTGEWSVTDDPGDASDVALLTELTNYGAQVVDFLNGSASLATVTIGIIDPPTIAGDQDSGITTGRLHDALARGAIRGRRGRLRRFISPTLGWVTIADGDCMEPTLNESYSSFSFAIRDTRERERKTKAFQKGSTTSLFPRGVIRQGVGPVAMGNAIPNVEHFPLIGRFQDDGNHSYIFAFDVNPLYWTTPITNPTINTHRMILGDDEFDTGVGRLIGTGLHASTVGRYQHFDFPNVVLWWRPVGGTSLDWVKIKPRFVWLDSPDQSEPNVFNIRSGGASYQGEVVRAVVSLKVLPAPTGFAGGVTPFPADAPLPLIGQDCEVIVTYWGPPTDSMPFHWAGDLGEGLQVGYDGGFSPKAPSPPGTYQADEFDPGVTVSTGIRYDAAVLATMTEDVVIRVTEPVADLRAEFEEHWYAPSGYAPALDLDGQVSPLHRRFPSSTAGLLTIDNSIAKAVPGWKVGTTIINLIRFKYGRLFFSPVDEDGFPIGDVDAIVRQEVEIWYVAAGGNLPIEVTGPEFLSQVSDSIAQFGERVHTIDAEAFLAVEALGLVWDQTLEQAWILAADAAATILPRYAFGTEVIEIPVRREPTALLRAGNWIGVDLSWMPDRRTQRRHLQTFAQAFEIEDNNCAWRFLRAEVGEATNLLAVAGASGGGSGGGAPFTSRSLIAYTGTSGNGSGGSAPYTSAPWVPPAATSVGAIGETAIGETSTGA